MNPKKYPKSTVVLLLLVVALVVTWRWTFTPHGRLDYRAALSLHLLSFTRTHQPDPNIDFEFELPVNLVYAFSAMLPQEAVGNVRDIVIPANGRQIPARVYWPVAAQDTPDLPVIVYFHGGGFVVGSVEIFDPLARSLANAANAIVVSVEYRLAPTHPYPAAVDDSYAAVAWAAANIASLGGDPGSLLVAGDSAGGNLAAVVALKARDEGGPEIAAQILYYPAVDLTATGYPSKDHFSDGYGLSTAAKTAFEQAYVGHVDNRAAPYISPLHAASLAGLPPALIVTAGFDPLTDAAIAYGEKLAQQGVAVTTSHFPEMIHGFMSVRLFPQHRDALHATSEFVAHLPPADGLRQDD